MHERPVLTSAVAAADFRAFYWLKAELLDFCRAHGLRTQGSKTDLAERIAAFLETGQVAPAPPKPATPRADRMPDTFTRATVIGAGWRCNEALRSFFRAEIGPQFHFNGVMRAFIAQGAGHSLQAAIDAWQASTQPSQPASAIAPQFEYNRFVRAFFQEHPEATRAAAIQAWNEHKARRR